MFSNLLPISDVNAIRYYLYCYSLLQNQQNNKTFLYFLVSQPYCMVKSTLKRNCRRSTFCILFYTLIINIHPPSIYSWTCEQWNLEYVKNKNSSYFEVMGLILHLVLINIFYTLWYMIYIQHYIDYHKIPIFVTITNGRYLWWLYID